MAWESNDVNDPESKLSDGNEAHKYPILIYGLHFLLWWFPRDGVWIPPHTHEFEHSTLLIRGKFIVSGDAEFRAGKELRSPDFLIFKANSEHWIKALTPNAYCLHFYPINKLILMALRYIKRRYDREVRLQNFTEGA